MGIDTVKSTPESKAAIKRMLDLINGGLTANVTSFKNDGEVINNPIYYEGAAAAAFREEWPSLKTALDTTIQKLNELADNVRAVNANIQAAGGNEA
ncbi:MAG TPA: WXG100 family type VII secretion target [Acidimicrobiales bacterium]|nr:WXG100 family type VII secretion target [Acidimicrobiales bacterium]